MVGFRHSANERRIPAVLLPPLRSTQTVAIVRLTATSPGLAVARPVCHGASASAVAANSMPRGVSVPQPQMESSAKGTVSTPTRLITNHNRIAADHENSVNGETTTKVVNGYGDGIPRVLSNIPALASSSTNLYRGRPVGHIEMKVPTEYGS